MAARGQLVLSLVVMGGVLLPAVRQAEAADKYIVLLDIEGERSPRLKKSIARMVKEQYKVMEGSSYRDAARRLRAQKLTPTNVKRVCGYLEADGVIDGTLVKKDGRYKFTLRVRSGVTGAIEKKIPMFINQPSLSQNMAEQLEERLLAAIADLPRQGGGTKVRKAAEDDEDAGFSRRKKSKKGKAVEEEEEEEEEEDRPRKMTKAEKKAAAKKAAAEKRAAEKAAREEAAREKKEEALARKKKKAREEEEEDEEEEEASSKRKKKTRVAEREEEDEEEVTDEDEEEEEEDEPKRAAMKDAGEDAEEEDEDEDPTADLEASVEKPRAPTSPRTTPLLINAGVSFIGRNLVFKHSATADLGPRGYEGKTVPGIYATGELYPMGFTGAKGALANVGFGFVADRVIKLNSAVSDDMNMTTLLPTRQSRYGASLRYRHNFGEGPRGLTLTGFVGYNKLSFVIDRSTAPENIIVDVPNTAYTYVDPGIGARIPLAGPLSALIEGRFMAVLGTGEIQQPEQYGAATVTGFDGDVGLEYVIGEHFLARAGARIIQIGYKFQGNGELSDRDGNDSSDVGGASDRYLGGYVTAGYAF